MAFSNGQNVQAADLNNFSVTTVTTTGAAVIGTTATVTGNLAVSGGLISLGASTSIVQSTSDAADNRSTFIAGGGSVAATRGAFIGVSGNEAASTPGVANISAGDVAGGVITLSTGGAERARVTRDGGLGLVDGISAPSTAVGYALLYVDSADGDLKVKFGDGTVKTIATDT